MVRNLALSLRIKSMWTSKKNAVTFVRFKQLCSELRNMIWKLSLPKARIIDIVYDKDQDKYLSFHSKTREARYVAQKFYNLCFPTQLNPANIYIRFDKDVIYFANWLTGYKYEKNGWFEHVNIGPIGKKGLGRHELRSIKRVAVNSVYFNVPKSSPPGADVEYFSFSVLPILSRFHSLKRLYVVVEDIDPYQEGEITFHKIPRHCHTHPAFCAFCQVSTIVVGFKDLKRNLTSPWRVPAVSVVGVGRNHHLSHMSQYQRCACNGFSLLPGVGCPNHPCEEYHPEPVKVAGLVAEENGMSEVIDDDLPEEEWRLAKDELNDLIADERLYQAFVEEYCDGKYGVNHEKWLGIEYLLSRPLL
ncbi:38d0e628-be16-42cd-b410-6a90753daaa9 [Sclerotinia trifoliorum]|uniref:38d0e628-be16-42cd-b410-6a90753daaa9 n=1 Tax=Sclerotinia trifoliorum TaxID=28548 RepID=A0A8H2VSU4_9HELO|nr:38d0e628-be16-42cd-b410-6a90753daaa9 [Sclerotinia trifoliorum]